MPIVSSVISADDAQADGRRYIREVHTDQHGREHVVLYLAPAVWDAEAVMAARVASLDVGLRNGEIANNIAQAFAQGSLAVTSLEYSTVAQNGVGFRQAYQTATSFEAMMMGDLLSTLTDAVLRTAFGITQQQVVTLRANKLTPASEAATAMRAMTGNGV
ncbi:MAG: hypothetical protein Q8P46_15100 [Hyphomicrobiales bacterium]|nr:hypothetical protein [Hyphomicrobiales bacterium]